MSTKGHDRESQDARVIEWLLGGDPSVRWQVLRDLTDAGVEEVARERARVSKEGWGARLLGLQRPDGQWGDGKQHPHWWTNLYTMVWLRDLGVDPESAPVRAAIALVRERVTWGEWHGYSPFFEGEVEPCINGRVVALAAYFGERTDALVDRLLHEQLDDGGWNCEAERGSVRSSFHTTICVLEGLLEYERHYGDDSRLAEAWARGESYLLERGLLRRRTSGEMIDEAWTRPAFPPLWRYDLLRGLDYFRKAGRSRDERFDEALALLDGCRADDGRWARTTIHPDTLHSDFGSPVGQPDRWVTLLATRVQREFGAS